MVLTEEFSEKKRSERNVHQRSRTRTVTAKTLAAWLHRTRNKSFTTLKWLQNWLCLKVRAYAFFLALEASGADSALSGQALALFLSVPRISLFH
jgi:hypothetical protein